MSAWAQPLRNESIVKIIDKKPSLRNPKAATLKIVLNERKQDWQRYSVGFLGNYKRHSEQEHGSWGLEQELGEHHFRRFEPELFVFREETRENKFEAGANITQAFFHQLINSK